MSEPVLMDNHQLIDDLRHQAKHNPDESLLHEAADRLELYVMEIRRLAVFDTEVAALRQRVAELEGELDAIYSDEP
jgi:hypothetical protein